MSRPVASLILSLALAACGTAPSDGVRAADTGISEMQGWRFDSGRRPSRAEYAALLAACEGGAVKAARGRPVASCLADLGLRRE